VGTGKKRNILAIYSIALGRPRKYRKVPSAGNELRDTPSESTSSATSFSLVDKKFGIFCTVAYIIGALSPFIQFIHYYVCMFILA
jgi:hypothetical protein